LKNTHIKLIAGIAVIMLPFIMEACGIFDTRTPENPVSVRSTYEPPTSPDAVTRNLTFSISEKNSNNYIKNLYPGNYRYVPDSKAQALYGTIFSEWDVQSEKLYLDNLISQTGNGASSNLFLSNTITTIISADSSITTSDYILVFQHNKTNIPKSAIGSLRWTMKTDVNSFYYISKWEDFRKNDSDFTWSEMKANFSN
jgi:hypothetical protein